MATFLSILKIAAPLILQIIGGLLAWKGHSLAASSSGSGGVMENVAYTYGQQLAGWAAILGGTGWHIGNAVGFIKAPAKAPVGVDQALHDLTIAHTHLVLDPLTKDEEITKIGELINLRRQKRGPQ